MRKMNDIKDSKIEFLKNNEGHKEQRTNVL